MSGHQQLPDCSDYTNCTQLVRLRDVLEYYKEWILREQEITPNVNKSKKSTNVGINIAANVGQGSNLDF